MNSSVPGVSVDSPASRTSAVRVGDRKSKASAATQWKRDVMLFAVAMIALVVAIALGTGLLMKRQVQQATADDLQWSQKQRPAGLARQAILEVDRLLLKTIALREPGAVREAAVASIAAATKVEDAIHALQEVLPGDASVKDMQAAVDDAKGMRMKLIGMARRGDADGAIGALADINPKLKYIDELSASLLQRLESGREEARSEREQQFNKLLIGLGMASTTGVVLGIAFYLVLQQRLKRVDLIEHLLAEVREGSEELHSEGDRLNRLNGELRQSNEALAGC